MKQYTKEVRRYFDTAYKNIITEFDCTNVSQYQSVLDFVTNGYIGGWIDKMFTYQSPVYTDIYPDDNETKYVWNEYKGRMMFKLHNMYFRQLMEFGEK